MQNNQGYIKVVRPQSVIIHVRKTVFLRRHGCVIKLQSRNSDRTEKNSLIYNVSDLGRNYPFFGNCLFGNVMDFKTKRNFEDGSCLNDHIHRADKALLK